MSRLDDRLSRELERAAPPADPTGAFERVERKRARRGRVRKLQAGALVVVVLAGTLGGVAVLSKVFRSGVTPGGPTNPAPAVSNGRIAVSLRSSGGLLELASVEPDGSSFTVIPIDTGKIGEPWLEAWSPDGGRLVVATSTTGSGPDALWVMNADGSDPVRIAEATNVYQMSWSPDGTQIAYAADTPHDSGIHVVNADGTHDRPIALAPASAHQFSASFSPDGSQIVFDQGTGNNTDLFVTTADGTNVRELTFTGTDYSPSWSPDGSRIVFSRRIGTGSDIFVMNADGSQAQRLTDGGPTVTNRDPVFSPDGTMIAYRSSPSPDGPGAVVVMGANGADPVIILEGSAMGIAWQALPATGPSPTPTTSPTPNGPVNIGLAFPVCDVKTMTGDFDGNGTPDTFYTATKTSDAPGCPAPGTATEVLGVDLNGDGKVDAVGGPPACPGGCEPFAAPDIDGDGTAEIASVVDRPADGTERIQLWRVVPGSHGGSTAILPFVDRSGMPATFTWGSDGTNTYGVSCTTRTSPPLLIGWQAIPTGSASWHVSEHGYHIVGTDLRSAFEDSYDVPGEETVFPDGGGSTMCGAAVVAPLSAPVVASLSPSAPPTSP